MRGATPAAVRTVELAVRCYLAGYSSAMSGTDDAFWHRCVDDVCDLVAPTVRVTYLPALVLTVVEEIRAESAGALPAPAAG